jgi:hypothetical protein
VNFTGKSEIPEKGIELDIDTTGDSVEVLYSIGTENISDLDNLKLVIQGNYRGELSRYVRKELTGGKDSIDGKYSLEIPYIEKDQSGSLTFNVYFIEGNLIKRYCEHISVSKNLNRTTILPAIPGDTGRKFWKIKYNAYQDGPILVLNEEINDASSTNIKNEAKTPEFIFKAYPSIIREILTKIIFELGVYSEENATSEWTENWMKFANIHSEETPDLKPEVRDPETVSKWIEEITRNFLAEQTDSWQQMIQRRRSE